MEKTWEIYGVTATWKMTVAILDSDAGDAGPPLPAKSEPLPDFEGLAEHFRTAVDLAEALWLLGQPG